MPVIAKVAAHALDSIKLRIILRDQNLEVMDMYLPPTGGRSIPKLIIFNEKGEQIATWGSRPEKLNTLAVALKASNLPFIEVVNRVYAWYDLPENQHEISDEVLQLLF